MHINLPSRMISFLPYCSPKSSCLTSSFSMLISANPSRRSCAIDERKYDFISFNFGKLRSALEAVTGSVQNRIHAVPSSVIDDITSDDSSGVKTSLTDSQCLISSLNSRRNDLTSETRSSPTSAEYAICRVGASVSSSASDIFNIVSAKRNLNNSATCYCPSNRNSSWFMVTSTTMQNTSTVEASIGISKSAVTWQLVLKFFRAPLAFICEFWFYSPSGTHDVSRQQNTAQESRKYCSSPWAAESRRTDADKLVLVAWSFCEIRWREVKIRSHIMKQTTKLKLSRFSLLVLWNPCLLINTFRISA